MSNNIVNRVKAKQASFNMPLNQEVTMNADGSGGPISINKQTRFDVSWNDPGLQNYSKRSGQSMDKVVKDYREAPGKIDSDWGHVALDALGTIPVFGAFADGANALWYATKGDWQNATMSGLAAIPGYGQFVTGAKYGKKGFDLIKHSVKNAPKSTLFDVGFGGYSVYDNTQRLLSEEKSKSEGSVEEENYNLENKGENKEEPKNINYVNNQRVSNRSKSFGQSWIDANRKKFNK